VHIVVDVLCEQGETAEGLVYSAPQPTRVLSQHQRSSGCNSFHIISRNVL
jgi:hypothetical protein